MHHKPCAERGDLSDEHGNADAGCKAGTLFSEPGFRSPAKCWQFQKKSPRSSILGRGRGLIGFLDVQSSPTRYVCNFCNQQISTSVIQTCKRAKKGPWACAPKLHSINSARMGNLAPKGKVRGRARLVQRSKPPIADSRKEKQRTQG